MERHDSLPPITIPAPDYERLSALVESASAATAWPELVEELDRARVVAPNEIPPDVVTMGAAVEYAEEPAGTVRRVVLVYPGEQDIGAGRVSVLTPIGTALIGLSVGQRMSWLTRAGQRKSLRVTAVHADTPESWRPA
ncbi:MAG: nucleoside diphosphate kinase regulator [Rhodospirillaceae bacterium]|nr:nucleoside diphosphate kinase regulator [Rhodospirillaceae bacterium]